MFEIAIEFLRRGPAHNQLLSPLTEYLVLCANRPAQSFRVPCEHAEFVDHVNALRYQEEDKAQDKPEDSDVIRPEDRVRSLHIKQIRHLLTQIMNDISGLEAEVIHADGEWLQLRLVLGPAELGLLPFEFASCPESLAGSDLPLALNAQRPIVVTREIRQNRSRSFEWHQRPKVLVVATDFPDAPVPVRAHLAGIRQALDPWIRRRPDGSRASDDLWKVIERATLDDILNECRRECYTHVHILAHGAALSANTDRGYGIVLHAASGQGKEVVEGERLATALCQPQTRGNKGRPFVVVLASCDSAARGDVVYSGTGVAQLLHTAGIPFVLASQYPLSAIGSAAMVTELYPRLFRGEDPRRALYYLRQRLRSCLPSTHDWASLVAYTCLPENLPRQLLGVRLGRMGEMLNVARDWYDPVDDLPPSGAAREDQTGVPAQAAAAEQRKKEWYRRIVAVEELLEAATQEIDSSDAEEHRRLYSDVCGLLARIWKAEAHILWKTDSARSGEVLRKAHRWYERGHTEKILQGRWPVSHWNATQYLCLTAVSDGHAIGKDALWLRARASAQGDLYARDPADQLWALASLIELWMLRPLTSPSPPDDHWNTARKRASRFYKDLAALAPQQPFVDAVRRQLTRYTTWWSEVQTTWPDFGKVVAMAQDLLAGRLAD